MAKKSRALADWQNAGLISPEQVLAIEAFENSRRKSLFGRGLTGLSIFAILVGVISIIASNWHAIPGEVKIATHVLINVFVAWLSWHGYSRNKPLVREGAALGFFGLTLTLIILIGQVYQLEGSPTPAITLCLIVTLPYMLLMGQGRMTAIPFVFSLLVALFLNLSTYLDRFSDSAQIALVISVSGLTPLVFLATGASQWVRARKPEWADVILKVGLVLCAVQASLATLFWGYFHIYDDMIHSDASYMVFVYSSFVVMVAGLSALYTFWLSGKGFPDNRSVRYAIYFAAASLVISHVPQILPQINFSVLGAVTFIAYWVFVAWCAQSVGMMSVVSIAIFLVAIRIFGLYVELFGSLMATGFGLILGGLVMLFLIWAARRVNAYMKIKVTG